jgi:hypothetical protein
VGVRFVAHWEKPDVAGHLPAAGIVSARLAQNELRGAGQFIDQTADEGGAEPAVAVRRVHGHPENLSNLVEDIPDISDRCC